jgi:hypothetical protein
MNKSKIIHTLCDALMTDAKMHIIVDALVDYISEYTAFEKLTMLLSTPDDELEKLPNIHTVDPIKVEKLVREEWAKYHSEVNPITVFGPITKVNIFMNSISYKYQHTDDNGEIRNSTGTYYYGNEETILKDSCID